MDSHVNLLLRKAADDRLALQFQLPDAIFGFLAQQSFEKLLKALIAAHGAAYERTHDLALLRKELQRLGEGNLPISFPIRKLQIFAVQLRYDDSDPIQDTERQDIREAIDEFHLYVANRANALANVQP